MSDGLEYNDEDEQLGFHVIDGIRKSIQIRERPPRIFQMRVRESVQKLGDAAVQAIHKEFSQMNAMGVFDPVHLRDLDDHQRKQIIRSSAFVKETTDSQGTMGRFRKRNG
jgi:hypothetical protein